MSTVLQRASVTSLRMFGKVCIGPGRAPSIRSLYLHRRLKAVDQMLVLHCYPALERLQAPLAGIVVLPGFVSGVESIECDCLEAHGVSTLPRLKYLSTSTLKSLASASMLGAAAPNLKNLKITDPVDETDITCSFLRHVDVVEDCVRSLESYSVDTDGDVHAGTLVTTRSLNAKCKTLILAGDGTSSLRKMSVEAEAIGVLAALPHLECLSVTSKTESHDDVLSVVAWSAKLKKVVLRGDRVWIKKLLDAIVSFWGVCAPCVAAPEDFSHASLDYDRGQKRAVVSYALLPELYL
jgi:hypothetical protein